MKNKRKKYHRRMSTFLSLRMPGRGYRLMVSVPLGDGVVMRLPKQSAIEMYEALQKALRVRK